MMKTLRNKFTICLLFTFLHVLGHAQRGNPMQFFSSVNQSAQINPALQNSNEKLVVGLPAIGGSTLNWNANFAVSDFHTPDLSFDFSQLHEALEAPGEGYTSAQIPLLFLSFKKHDATFDFALKERFIGTTSFDEELITFYAQGLLSYYGKNEDIGTLSLKSIYFREISFRYAKQIWKNLSIGVRPKLLFGKFFYDINEFKLAVSTNTSQQQLSVTPRGEMVIAGPVKAEIIAETQHIDLKPNIKASDYFFKLRNMGAAIDLGFTYNIDKLSTISFSVIDLGFTSAKYQAYNNSFTKSINYHQSSLYQSHSPNESSYWPSANAFSSMADSIPYISEVKRYGEARLDLLPLQLNASFQYKMPNDFQLGIANHYTYFKSYSSNFFTAFLQAKPGKNLETVATISLYNFDTIMPGIGMCYTNNSFQFYFSSNNIIGLVQSTSAKNLNLSFGVNFLFSTR